MSPHKGSAGPAAIILPACICPQFVDTTGQPPVSVDLPILIIYEWDPILSGPV